MGKEMNIKKAAESLSNLNMWAAIQALAEGSLFYGNHNYRPLARVINIAKAEQQKELKRYDYYTGKP